MRRDGLGREAVLYLFCGVVSSAVSWAAMFALNFAAFHGTAHPNAAQNVALGMANWTAGMLTAYALNRKVVFRSDRPVLKEFPPFAASRVWTLFVDQGGRQALSAMGLDIYIVTLAMTAVVTVLNYITGKLLVFRKKD